MSWARAGVVAARRRARGRSGRGGRGRGMGGGGGWGGGGGGGGGGWGGGGGGGGGVGGGVTRQAVAVRKGRGGALGLLRGFVAEAVGSGLVRRALDASGQGEVKAVQRY